jgi:hypothetical protein
MYSLEKSNVLPEEEAAAAHVIPGQEASGLCLTNPGK